jgi:hypothetical protein
VRRRTANARAVSTTLGPVAVRIPSERIAWVHGAIGRWLVRALLLVLITLVPAVSALEWLGEAAGLPGHVGWYVFLGVPGLALAALLPYSLVGEKPGVVSLRDAHLVLEPSGGRPRARHVDAIESGTFEPREGVVEIALRDGDRVRIAADRDQARALLEGAGLDASRRTVRVRLGDSTFLDALSILLGGPFVAWPITTALAREVAAFLQGGSRFGRDEGYVMGHGGYLVFFVLLAILFRLVRALRGPGELVIGADGLTVKGGLRARFVSWARVREVRTDEAGVRVVRDDGSVVFARGRHVDDGLRATIALRVEEAREAWRRGGLAAERAARLDRGGRDLEAWRDALRKALADDGRYREAPMDRDDVARVLDSAASPAERRIGAALLLAEGSDGEAGRERVRVAARAAASPRLRIALERVADGSVDEAAIDEALAAERAEGRAR